jgi:hypothetical protein
MSTRLGSKIQIGRTNRATFKTSRVVIFKSVQGAERTEGAAAGECTVAAAAS